MADVPPTGDRQFRNQVVRIPDLTVNTFVLERLEFLNCRILGPAVLVPQGRTSIVHCGWDAPSADALFWEIPPSRQLIVGAVAVVDCTFSLCTFTGIGLAGPPELRGTLEQMATGPGSGTTRLASE